jgi:UDP-4-amino-4,6-dideoxy-N-acetyl-beta-L-altrosamine transaminase
MQADTSSPAVCKKAIPYSRQYIDNDDIQAVLDVLRSDRLTQGPAIREFEERFSEYCGSRYAVAVSSGTAGLHLACIASEISSGDKVITSPMTFAASANCALYVGAAPVFVDIDPDTVCIDPQKLDEYLENKPLAKPKAVIPVHFAGLPCDMETISVIAGKKRLKIIEDACHALGAVYPSGEKVGSCKYSDMTVFSFHPVKHITTGEGGMITTNDPELYKKLLRLRSHGITKISEDFTGTELSQPAEYYYEMQELGFNYRITDIQCALGSNQLRKADEFLRRRAGIADFYNSAFKCLEDHLILPHANNSCHAWHLYVIRLKNGDRDIAFRRLKESGIGVQVHYVPVYFHPYYQKMGFKKGLCPAAEDYFEKAISLPIYPSMDRHDMERVVNEVSRAIKN